MGLGLTPQLVLAAVVAGALSLLMLGRHLPPLAALLAAAVKAAVPLVYFAWFYDGTWTFLDDVTYWDHGRLLLATGYDPFTVLLRADGVATLVMLSLGPHILYAWWNLLAQYFLGPYYFAPVFLNVVLTCASGVLLYRIARRAGFGERYAGGLLLFFVLHWELLVWSSFVNLKDVLVFTLVLAALLAFLVLADSSERASRRWLAAAVLAGVFLTLPWLRFYVPALLLASFGAWWILRRRGWARPALLAVGALLGVLALPWLAPMQYLELHPVAVAFGFVKGPLTPRPWAIYPEYSFLTLAAWLHWVTFVPALIGGWALWRHSPPALLAMVYLLIASLLSAIAPEFQGPRHRVHVIFAWAWMQYHAFALLASLVAARRARPVDDAVPATVATWHAPSTAPA